MRFLGMELALSMLKMKRAAASVPLGSVQGAIHFYGIFASYRDELGRVKYNRLLLVFSSADRARPELHFTPAGRLVSAAEEHFPLYRYGKNQKRRALRFRTYYNAAP